MINKICNQCKIEKQLCEFRHVARNDKTYINNVCKKCDVQNNKNRHLKFRQAHREELRKINKNYYAANKEEIKEKQKDKKKIRDKKYYINNKKKILERQKLKSAIKYKNDPCFRVKKTVSKAISRHLKLNFSSKNKQSCLNYLQYSIEELKKHLENQFEPWMNWNNYGIYRADKWNDNDQDTWTWQIDHIIPHSTFKYTSMKDEEFKKCWSLSNLRPLSSKINILEGVQRTRHGDLSWSS